MLCFTYLSLGILNAFLGLEDSLLQVRIPSHVLKVPALLLLLLEFFLLLLQRNYLLLVLLKQNLLLLRGGRNILCDPPAQFGRIDVVNGAPMVGKLVELDKSLVAYVALVTLSRVAPDVGFQVVALGERFRTVRAFVGLRSVVGTAVDDQIVMTMEAFPAYRAEMSFFVGVVLFVNLKK